MSRRTIRSREEFHSDLLRERAGSDRNGHGFSLLVFDGETVKDFVHTLNRRTRQIDQVGWLDWRVGVLLPYTTMDGAKTLTQDIRRELGPSMPKCTIYTYPGDWLPDDDDDSGSANPGIGSTALGGRPDELLASRLPIWKRSIDVAGSLVGLVLLSPIFLLVALLIKAVSPGPAFYKQKRIGRHGKAFMMWKFRTMRPDAESTLHQEHMSSLITQENSMTKLDARRDPRVFSFGKVLRRCYVDELPQLINVLRGDMSLVGPRPCIPYEAKQYTPWQTGRFEAVPGMTGLWQVQGKNRTTFKEMVRLDIAYARNRSFLLDAGVLLKTVPTILAEILGAARARPLSPWERAAEGRVRDPHAPLRGTLSQRERD